MLHWLGLATMLLGCYVQLSDKLPAWRLVPYSLRQGSYVVYHLFFSNEQSVRVGFGGEFGTWPGNRKTYQW